MFTHIFWEEFKAYWFAIVKEQRKLELKTILLGVTDTKTVRSIIHFWLFDDVIKMKFANSPSKIALVPQFDCLALEVRMGLALVGRIAFGIGRTQAQKILKEKEVILAEYENNMQSCKKRVRSANYSDVNEALWEWNTRCRESNIPVDGTMLQEEALLIAEKLGISGFTASTGWLQHFKQGYNLQKKANAGEDGDVSKETLESWHKCVREITRGWSLENVWNMDETGSFWRGLPDTSLKRDSDVGEESRPNTGIHGPFFVNAAGENGKYAKPRFFNNLKDIKRPYGCWYYANPKAWMNTEIMKDVLARLNEKLKRKKRNILLLMDNAPCHPPRIANSVLNISIKFQY